MEHETYEVAVPEGYREVYHIDASDKKTGVKLTVVAFVIMIAVLAAVLLCADFSRLDLDGGIIKYYAVWLVATLAYIVLHELVHGAVYKALTHQKLCFGITWSAAFCGVPDIYTYRKTAISSLVAPLTVFTIVFLPLTIWMHSVDTGWYLVCGLLLAIHLSGCAGDIYVTWLFARRFRDPRTLMRDTGPAQWMYAPEE